MHNPYQAPESAIASSKPKGRFAQLTISILIAVFCTLQIWGISYLIISTWNTLGVGETTSIFWILSRLIQPMLLFLSGIFLLFQRKIATYGFSIYVIAGLLTLPEVGRGGAILSLLIVLSFLAYSAFLHKKGKLR